MTTLILSQPRILLSSLSRVKVLEWALALNLTLLLCVSIFLRTSELDHIPGVNGDEALVAVQVADMMAGRPAVLKMPTGRLLSPIYGISLMAVETIFDVSFWTLRSPALISGLLLVFLSYFLIRNVLGNTIALFTTILVATSPVNIAYSRLGIEQSLMSLSSLLCLYFAIKGRWKGSLISFIVALLVHPVDVFLMPVLILPLAVHIFRYPDWTKFQKNCLVLASLLLLYLGVLFEVFFLPEKYQILLSGERLGRMLLHWPDFGAYFSEVLRILTGMSAYAQFSVEAPSQFLAFWQAVWGASAVLVSTLGMIVLVRRKKWLELSVVGGTLLALFGYYWITGIEAILPGVSRYALWMIVPAFVSLSLLLDSILLSVTAKRASLWILSLLGWSTLAHFQFFYLNEFRLNNCQTHCSYRTGKIEPKQAAFQWITEDFEGIRPRKSLTIVAENWWTYWPIRYLALARDGVTVWRWDEYPDVQDQLLNLAGEGGYFIGFHQGVLQALLEGRYGASKLEKKAITGYGKEPILAVLRLKR